jgi:hypothetical protein
MSPYEEAMLKLLGMTPEEYEKYVSEDNAPKNVETEALLLDRHWELDP